MSHRQIVFHAQDVPSAAALTVRLMSAGMSVDRIPKPGYLVVKAVGEADDSFAAQMVEGVSATVESDEAV